MKILDYDLTQLPQDPIDCIEDIKTTINFGKYQIPIVTSTPGWAGRRGEFVILVTSANSGRFIFCNSDNSSSTWITIANFG